MITYKYAPLPIVLYIFWRHPFKLPRIRNSNRLTVDCHCMNIVLLVKWYHTWICLMISSNSVVGSFLYLKIVKLSLFSSNASLSFIEPSSSSESKLLYIYSSDFDDFFLLFSLASPLFEIAKLFIMFVSLSDSGS